MKYSYYRIKIIGKSPKIFLKRIIKMNIHIINISYINNDVYIDIDHDNYQKLLKLKTSYKYKIIKRFGISNIVFLLNKYQFFYLTVLFSILIIYILSNIIFEVDVINNDEKIKRLVYEELNNYKVSKFHLVKSYNKQEKIAKKIINNNRDKIEWIELKRDGVKYTVNVEERKKAKEIEKKVNRNVVAKKQGIILKIDAKSGEVVKKINDYVNKGDVVVSGLIKNKDVVKEIVSADAKIYAEVWYTVNVSLPLKYKEVYHTNKNRHVLRFKFLNSNIAFFNNYKDYDDSELFMVSNNVFPISFGLVNRKKVRIKKYNLNKENATKIAIKKADNKINKKLKEEEYIISKKVLKNTINNSTIDIEVFYKVYENITGYQEIKETKDEINKKLEEEVKP